MDINILAFLAPAGIIACFRPLTDSSTFNILYLVTSVYFSGVMVRLMLMLAPAACIVGSIALSAAFDTLTRSINYAPAAPLVVLIATETKRYCYSLSMEMLVKRQGYKRQIKVV
ncbi:hypothetical protein M758_UG080000 [Ceratodon purpureus]|nr:hypothetical protein M758_UG080000 [Ceratodon purpureus]